MRNYPKVLALLLSGELTVCSLSAVSRILTRENHEDVISRVKGKTRREIDQVIAEFRPVSAVREVVKPVVIRAVAKSKTVTGDGSSAEDLSEPSNAKRPEIYRRGGGKFLATALPTATTSGTPYAAVPGDAITSATVDGDSSGDHDEADGDGRGEPKGDSNLKHRFKIEFAADGEFVGNMEKIRSLLSGRFPAGVSMEKLFGIVMDDYLDRHSSAKRNERRKCREERAMIARNECQSIAGEMARSQRREREQRRDGGKTAEEVGVRERAKGL